MAEFSIGDDVYVKQPQRYFPGCVSITGPVVAVGGGVVTMEAYIAREGGGARETCSFAADDVGRRIGTPLSQLSGRPGHPGYDEFKRIAASWGYD